MRTYIKSKNQLFIIFLIVGFFMGIVYWNVVMGEEFLFLSIFQKSSLKRVAEQEIVTKTYLLYILRERIALAVIVGLLGAVKWKKTITITFLIVVGFINGVLISNVISAMGAEGLLIYIAGVFPQVIFYVAAMAMMLVYWYAYPEREWNRTKTAFVLIMLAVGMITEAYVNPWIVKWVVGIL